MTYNEVWMAYEAMMEQGFNMKEYLMMIYSNGITGTAFTIVLVGLIVMVLLEAMFIKKFSKY